MPELLTEGRIAVLRAQIGPSYQHYLGRLARLEERMLEHARAILAALERMGKLQETQTEIVVVPGSGEIFVDDPSRTRIRTRVINGEFVTTLERLNQLLGRGS